MRSVTTRPSRRNICQFNGFDHNFAVGGVFGSGILVSCSPNVEIYENTVEWNHGGISGIEADRSPDVAELYGSWNCTI